MPYALPTRHEVTISLRHAERRLRKRALDLRPYPPLDPEQHWVATQHAVQYKVPQLEPFDFLAQAGLLKQVYRHHGIIRPHSKNTPLDRAMLMAHDRNARMDGGNSVVRVYWIVAIFCGLMPQEPTDPPTLAFLPIEQMQHQPRAWDIS